jgi:UDP-N-acetylmuramoyl-tripeptide--D-alanyl-D-alanine ligase
MNKEFFKALIVRIITEEARLVLRKFKPHVIAVTGSVGKTGTKDAIYHVLRNKFYVRKSDKSFNSEIGVPLTILGCPNAWANPLGWIKNVFVGITVLFRKTYPQILVLEVGADRPGDILSLAKWLKPHTVVITRLPDVPVHVEYFNTPEDVINEKFNLVKFSDPDARVFLCSDDPKQQQFLLERQNTILYGSDPRASIRGEEPKIFYDEGGRPAGMTFIVKHRDENDVVLIKGILGNQIMYAALAAISVGISRRMSLKECVTALNSLKTPPGRMKILEGVDNTILIDDTYNSSPVALGEAIRTLEAIKTTGRKIAILGDMLELGRYSVDEHKAVSALTGFLDRLYLVGVRARDMGKTKRGQKLVASRVKKFDSADEAISIIKKDIKSNDIFLIKGSQGMRMEKITKSLLDRQERSSELLVRQEEAWLNK